MKDTNLSRIQTNNSISYIEIQVTIFYTTITISVRLIASTVFDNCHFHTPFTQRTRIAPCEPVLDAVSVKLMTACKFHQIIVFNMNVFKAYHTASLGVYIPWRDCVGHQQDVINANHTHADDCATTNTSVRMQRDRHVVSTQACIATTECREDDIEEE